MVKIIAYPGYEVLAQSLVAQKVGEVLAATIRLFPDGDSFVQFHESVKNETIIVVCGLDRPNDKMMPLMFLANAAKEFGAKKILLVAPYLGYMRQDKAFHEGEVVTSKYFARFLSQQVDGLITVDPHLHRYHSLNDIYTIPTGVVHAADDMALWIKHQVISPLIIGPDEESRQWVSDVAQKVGAPYQILNKTRLGDKKVQVSLPDVNEYAQRTPVLVDDIISTAATMMEATKHLKQLGMNAPVCVGVHAIFASDAHERLLECGVKEVVSCNTVMHSSNKIDISTRIAKELVHML